MAIEWYIKNGEKAVGPLSSTQLKELASRKKITLQTLVRRGDRSDWIAAGAIRDLFDPQQPQAAESEPSTPSNEAALAAPRKPSRLLLWSAIGTSALMGVGLILALATWLVNTGSSSSAAKPPTKAKQVANKDEIPAAPKKADGAASDGYVAAAHAPPQPPPPPKPEPHLSTAYRKAVLLNEHGLTELAKAELIDVLMSKAVSAEKARAYYLLGSIAFSEKRISSALSTWKELVAAYPDSQEATDVKDRIDQLAEIAGENAKESANNAVAESYLRNGDFWSNDRDKIFNIDTSWIPHVESAIKWYDKVIAEFPGSAASRIAYKDKLFTLIGWKDRRYDSIRFGLEEDFEKYMPLIQETLAAFEKEHPTASAIQAFRFQIAQAYWGKNDLANAKVWLEKMIAAAGDDDSFYAHLARERLARLQR
jgi:TolA-binding protein